MSEFIELFGNYEILGFNIKNICLFLIVILAFYKKVYLGMWLPYYESQKSKDEMMQTAFQEIEKLNEQIRKLDKRNRKYELSSTRSELLKQYRYFANEHINPMLAWTEMEKHAFDDQFESYILSGGNSFLSSVVQPEMEKLEVIVMEDSDRISQLYKSRTNAN